MRKYLYFILLLTFSCSEADPVISYDREIENLTAFAKSYGLIKYFHPSDEARLIDWDKLAIHGVNQVIAASDDDELRQALESLILPLAPTVRFTRKELAENDFLPEYLDNIEQNISDLETVAWQHQSVDMEFKYQHIFSSNRVNRNDRAKENRITLSQTLEAHELQGHDVQLQVMVKTELEESGNQGMLFIRVEDEDGVPVSFETQPFDSGSSAEWKSYEVLIDIDPTAKWITAGIVLKGRGRLWFDDISLLKNQGAEWIRTELEIPASDLQFHGRSPDWRWEASGTYDFRVDSNTIYSGSNSIHIAHRDVDLPDSLFIHYPEVGETSVLQIAESLWIEVPLALYSSQEQTLPEAKRTDVQRLKNELDLIYLSQATGSNLTTRLANVIIVWNVMQHFYPYFGVIDTDWNNQLKKSLHAAINDKSIEDFYETLCRMIASLHDGHGRVFHHSVENQVGLPFIVDLVEGEIVITHSLSDEFLPGDIIRMVDDVPALTLIESSQEMISGSPQHSLFLALREFSFGEYGTEANITLIREDEEQNVIVNRSGPYNYQMMEKNLPVISKLEDDILYVDLDRVSVEKIRDRIDKIASFDKIIFDIRGYPDNHLVLSHLLTEADTSSQWMQTPQVIYPNQNVSGYEKLGWNLIPASPSIDGEVIFITDGRAISYPESILGFVDHYGLAEIVGSSTAGANGGVNWISLPGQYRVSWTGMKVVKHDGSQHHIIGIEPTVPVNRTIQGIREQRDEYLEKAVELMSE